MNTIFHHITTFANTPKKKGYVFAKNTHTHTHTHTMVFMWPFSGYFLTPLQRHKWTGAPSFFLGMKFCIVAKKKQFFYQIQ
jgi:hypothetical protein